MKSNNIDTNRISSALATLKNKIKAVDESLERAPAPKLKVLNNLAEIPKEKRENIEKQLWSIFIYGKYPVKKILDDLHRRQNYTKIKNDTNHAYYLNEYLPINKNLCALLNAGLAPSRLDLEELANDYMDIYENPDNEIERLNIYERYALNGDLISIIKDHIKRKKANQPHRVAKIKNSLANAIVATDLLARCVEQIEDLGARRLDMDTDEFAQPKVKGLENIIGEILSQSDLNDSDHTQEKLLECDSSPDSIHYKITTNLNNILGKHFFRPDEWIENEDDCPPFFISEKIPPHVKSRIIEIRKSFIFGNWMSVIALSRCLLEYAIIDRKDFLKLDEKRDIYDDKGNKKPLTALIKTACEVTPELTDGMHLIRKQANEIMHPSRKSYLGNNKKGLGKIVALVPPQKGKAKQCMEEISKIINALYASNQQ